MRKGIIWLMAFVPAAVLSACGRETDTVPAEMGSPQTQIQDTADTGQGSEADAAMTGEMAHDTEENLSRIPELPLQIPAGYGSPASEQGTLEQLDYTTYESFTYEEKTKLLTKTAYVYLPYGYSEETPYNVFYLMHGGWSNETMYLGTPDNPSVFKNIVDHAIQNGEIEPLIIVCPTYNNENPNDSDNYGLALRLTDNYHNELVNDLIPAVEGKYSTYAEGTSAQALADSRDHRAFAGFSMGSVTTWHTFEYCLDYFRYFFPSSGDLTSDGEYMESIVINSGYSPEDFFIYAMSGTEDFDYSAFTRQIQAMLDAPGGIFIEADNEADGNLAYRVQEGNSHNGEAAMQYMYNGLTWLWKE
ncbi:MAG: alpha/beta hydrolase-fold protein [Roseburia sp.]|nr:alpha/beta hydrolase-fold protein [Roseburia sp.]